MNTLFKLCFLVLLPFLFMALSPKKIIPNYSQQEEEENKTSLLWKISGNGLSKSSYLFGTMHLIQKDYFYFPSSLEKIIKKSDLVITEIDIDEMMDQAAAAEYLTLEEGKLMDFFNEKQQDSIYDWAKKKLFIDRATFDQTFSKLKPFVILQTAIQLNFIGKTESYEIKINNLATKHKIKTHGLETIGDQINIFDDMTKAEQAEMVMEVIRNEEKSINELNKMQRLYFHQQLDSLSIMIQEKGNFFAKQENNLLVKRNQKWMETIENYMKESQTFIAVGAAHLPSENGLIELLRKKGYSVNPLKL